jgi:hypothetical protein
MIVRRILLAAGLAALMTTPALALPGHAPSNEGTGHARKCMPHKVAYVASGLLVSQTLTKDGTVTPTVTASSLHQNADDTYSGDITVDVKHTNHHARADKGHTVTYSVSHVRVRFGLADINNDGAVGLDDVRIGARVKLIGKITTLARTCDQTGFTPQTTIRQVVFHAPPHSAS